MRISYLRRTDGRTDGQTETKVHLLSCASQLKSVKNFTDFFFFFNEGFPNLLAIFQYLFKKFTKLGEIKPIYLNQKSLKTDFMRSNHFCF